MRRMLVGVATVVALGLTGCSTSGDDAAAPAAGDQVAAADAPAGTEVNTENAKALCAHLKEELPRIQAVGSEVGAMAQLTMSLASFYDGREKELDGTVLDAQVAQECPETGAAMLKAAGMKSFSDF